MNVKNKYMKQLYWCDVCSNKKLDVESELEYNSYFSCYTTQQFSNHLKSKKHIANKKKIDDDSDSILCKKCNKKFSKEGYEVHKNRNERWWKLGKINNISCNNFSINTHRFSSFQDLLDWNNRPKQTRTKVGAISPITHVVRKKNNLEKHIEKELIQCNYCNGALFTSQYDTKFLDKHNTFVCGCSDEIQLKQETKFEDSSSSSEDEVEDIESIKMKIIENPDFNGAIIKNTETLDDDNDNDWVTEKPKFDDYCEECNLPINYHYSIKLMDNWNIDTCACTDSDYTDSD